MAPRSKTIAIVLIGLVIALAVSGCRATAEVTLLDRGATAPNARGASADDSAQNGNPFADPVGGGGIDFRLTRSDIACAPRDLNPYPQLPVEVAHVVVDGNLGAPCHGEPDERLVIAWQLLASISPPGELRDLALFTGFTSHELGHTTLAFVNRVDVPGSAFQMSVNLDEARRDPTELRLTIAHEFAHVITTGADQLDGTVRPRDCDTWHNRRGCFRNDSLMWSWIETFWGDGLVDDVNLKLEPSPLNGLERCAADDGFFGPYAASHPEEDFAEAFSAFVFRVEPRSDGQRRKMAWFADQPDLLLFRNHAIESGLAPLRYRFESCG